MKLNNIQLLIRLNKLFVFIGYQYPISNIENLKCVSLPLIFNDRTSSVSIHPSGECVKLYDKVGCKGKYVKIKGRDSDLRLIHFNDKTSSVGKC